MSLEVKYIDAPPGAQEDMETTAVNVNAMSVPELLPKGGVSTPWATLETYGWPLDGTRELLPEAPSVPAWSSSTSDDSAGILGVNRLGSFILGKAKSSGLLENPPVITLRFSERFSATGLSIAFAEDEWCNELHIAWYNGQTLLAEGTYFPDSPRWTLAQVVEGFDKIQIELHRTSKGGHFAKVNKIELGQNIVFARDELASVLLVHELDPTLSELTVDTMTVSIMDKHDRALYPQENQQMELYKNGKLIATQYITESAREGRNGYSFTCQSAIGLLEDDFLGGLYTEEPAANVVADIMDGRPYDLGAFSDAPVSGYIPVCTRREALQQVAFAVGALVITQETGVVRFSAIPEHVSGSFRKGEIFLGGSMETTPRIYKIDVDAHTYAPSEEVETLVEDEPISGEDVLLVFDEPHYAYELSGGTLLQSGANWVRISAAGAAVTLTGKKYMHNIVRHTKRNTLATAAERNNVQTIDSATLIHSGNVQSVLDRLFKINQLRQTLTQEVVVNDQHAGQMVTTEGPWEEGVKGYISAMVSELTQGGHTATVTIIGERKQPESAYRYAGEIYSGDMGVLF